MTERILEYSHDGFVFDVLDQGPLDGPIVIEYGAILENAELAVMQGFGANSPA